MVINRLKTNRIDLKHSHDGCCFWTIISEQADHFANNFLYVSSLSITILQYLFYQFLFVFYSGGRSCTTIEYSPNILSELICLTR